MQFLLRRRADAKVARETVGQRRVFVIAESWGPGTYDVLHLHAQTPQEFEALARACTEAADLFRRDHGCRGDANTHSSVPSCSICGRGWPRL